MTKEDFDAEVYEYAKSRIDTEDSRMTDRMLAYRAGAEPREKQIDELKAQIKVLEQNLEDTEICENGLKNRIAGLEDKLANADYQLEGRDLEIKELEAQIEKMKCGQNCKYSYLYQEDRKCKFTYCDCINCKDKWELRR